MAADLPVTQRSLLVVMRHSPYGSTRARAALDIVLAAGAFEQSVSVLFCGDGVLQLVPGQEARVLGRKSLAKQLAALPLYDIDKLYADEAAIERHGIDVDQAPVPVEVLGTAAIHALMAQHDHLLGL